MNGFINLLKPAGMTSSDAVLCVKKLLPRKTAVGHGGTLDPDAAGVLPICVGKATRLFNYIIDKKKTYIGELTLGITTTTDDAGGEILSVSPVRVSENDLQNVLTNFIGDVQQVPPMYSALKRDGVALYKLARQGATIELESRTVRIDEIEIVRRVSDTKYLLKIVCGKGTYIRSLMRDIGAALGCGGHMSFLLRVQSGAFKCENAVSIDELRSLVSLDTVLTTMDYPLGAFYRSEVKREYRMNIINGQPITAEMLVNEMPVEGTVTAIYCGNEFAGMGEGTAEHTIKIRAMLIERE